jgi:hypothetical protein
MDIRKLSRNSGSGAAIDLIPTALTDHTATQQQQHCCPRAHLRRLLASRERLLDAARVIVQARVPLLPNHALTLGRVGVRLQLALEVGNLGLSGGREEGCVDLMRGGMRWVV